MKIGVISDTHIAKLSLHPKKLASRFLNKVTTPAGKLCEVVGPHFSGADLIIHAGDVVSFPVITALEEFATVEAVAGNMDPHEISSRYPYKQTVKAGGIKIGIMHGHGPAGGLEFKIRREFDEVDLIVFGHSHTPFLGEVDGILMFNPGSPTDKRWAPHHAIGVLEIGGGIKGRHIKLD